MQDFHNWFAFDMSIPDMRSSKLGNPVLTRMSEIERDPPIGSASGVWLDAFDNIWYNMDMVSNLLQQTKKVCIVSPELHGRNEVPLWSSLRNLSAAEGLMICTDYLKKLVNFQSVSMIKAVF